MKVGEAKKGTIHTEVLYFHLFNCMLTLYTILTNHCHIFQIRLTNGQALTQSFSVKEPLAAVKLYVEMNRTDPPCLFNLMTNFPKKVFTGEDYEKPLTELGKDI